MNIINDIEYDYITTGNPNIIRLNCPYCQDQKHHLYVNLDPKSPYLRSKNQSVGFCHRCSKTIYPRLDEPLRKPNSIQEIESQIDLSGLISIMEGETYIAKLARKYLISRNIFDHKGIYYSENLGYWKGRIVFPLFEQGEIVFAIGRSFTSINPKYKFPVGLKKSNYLYVHGKPDGQAFLLEGVTDSYMFSGGIALLGKQLSDVQLYKLLSIISSKTKVFIFLDSDAVSEAIQIAYTLLPYFENRLKIVIPPQNRDANDLKGDLSECNIYDVNEPTLISIQTRSIPISSSLSNSDNYHPLLV